MLYLRFPTTQDVLRDTNHVLLPVHPQVSRAYANREIYETDSPCRDNIKERHTFRFTLASVPTSLVRNDSAAPLSTFFASCERDFRQPTSHA